MFRPDGKGGYFETKLVSSDLAGAGRFGESVSINFDGVIAVGAPAGTGLEASTGSVYIYTPDGYGGFTETLLYASDGLLGDGFGSSVTIHDNGVVVVGATSGEGAEENTGAVYVYTPDGGGGYTEAKLTASEGNTSDFFGFSSDMNASGVVVVGAYGDDDFGAPNSGSAYVFTPDGAGGYTEVKLTALDRFDWDHFGYDVAINDSGAIVVGAYGNDDTGSASGAAYVYVPDGSGGYTSYKLTAPLRARVDNQFGRSVDINEDGVVMVGALNGDANVSDTGLVYTFVPNADGDYVGYDGIVFNGVPADGSGANPGHDVVPLPGVLFATGGVAADQFHETAINDLGMVLVGAPGDHTGSLTNNGSVYLFRPNAAGSLHSPLQLTASDAANHDAFGNAVDLNNTGVAVVGGGGGLAAVYVFRPDGKGGYFETKLVSSDLAGAGRFGESVSINFDGVIAVGAPAGTGVEASTGSVYIYTPDGYGGFTETLLYASDGLLGDGFGSSVTIHDNGVVVVGATSGEGAEENTGAVYVYTPDGGGGYTEAKLTASEGNTSDFFGFSSDMNASGVVVVGAYGDDDFGAPNSGSAYVFTPDGAGGYTEVKLTALDRFDWDHFGYDVAINDSGVIVVGAYGNDDTGSASGAAYVYVPDGSGGYTSYKLTAPLRARVDNQFGRSVDINEDGVVMVGALNGDGTVSDSGLVYTFVPNADGDYVGYDGIVFNGVPADGSGTNPDNDVVPVPSVFLASDGLAADQFHETAVNDLGMVLVGAPGDHTGSLTNNGSVYLYRPNAAGTAYTSVQLTASDAASHDGFGNAVALNNSGVAVVAGGGRLGAVYVFRPDGKGGMFEAKLVSSDLAGGGNFGGSISVNSNGVIAVGASTGNGLDIRTGSAYIYEPDGYGGYTETVLFAADGLPNDGFGSSVTVHDSGVVLVGASNGEGAEADTGAVYVYTPDGAGGYTEAKLIASEGNSFDLFGHSVDVNASGVIVVGAYGDDDFGAPNSGSAYVFTPDGVGGYTEVKLTALDRFDWDMFGHDVAINDSGVIVVGAHGNDDQGSASGAAYVYVPDGLGGYTVYKLTAPLRPGIDNQFGHSVDINDDGVVTVGALNGTGRQADTGMVYSFVPNADGDYVGFDGIVYNGVPADGSGTNPDHDVVPVPTWFKASDGETSDLFHETAVNDLGMVLIGAPGDHTDGLTNNGSVYLYRPNAAGTAYSSIQLTASDAAHHDGFGNAVALNNSGVAVVAGGGRLGAVYVFRPDGKGGMFEAKLVSSDLAGGGNFGVSVSVNSAGVIVAGASTGTGLEASTGSVYVYAPDGYGGYKETVLFASDGLPGDGFGNSVTVHDNSVVVVGATNGDGAAVNTGAVYVYTPDGAGGYSEAKLTASEGNVSDFFGFTSDVNASGVVVVGAYGDDDNGNPNAGSAYIYTPDGAGGYTEVKLVSLDRDDWDMFGYDVAINDSGVVVVGAYGNDDNGSATGSAYVYEPDGSGGYTSHKLTAPLWARIGDSFGHSVDINNDGVVTIGALNGDGRKTDSGSVFSYVPNENGDYVSYGGIVYSGTVSAGLNIVGSDAGNTLTGGASDDVLTGGLGNDTFVFAGPAFGHDTITDFAAGAATDDSVQLDASVFTDFADVLAAATEVGGNTVVTVGANASIELEGVSIASLHQDDFSFV